MDLTIRKQRVLDDDPDLTYLGEYTDEWQEGAIDRFPDDRYGRYARGGEYRYFVPAMSAEDSGPEGPQADFERMEAYNRGDWAAVGVRVQVTLTDERGFTKVIESGGLWGVESDSGDAYFEEVAREEWMAIRASVAQYVPMLDAVAAFDGADWDEKS